VPRDFTDWPGEESLMQEQIEYLPISAIKTAKQVREHFDEQGIRDLAASMAEVGLLQPIRVRPDRTITAGERRYRAAKLLGWKDVACIVEAEGGNANQRMLIENCQREDLKPLEKARAIASLMEETGWSGAETAKRLGMSPAAVSKLTAILTLPADVQAKVEEGAISASAAYALTRADGSTLPQLAEKAANGASRDAIAGAVRRPRQAEAKSVGRVLCRLADGAAVTVSASELTIETFIELLEGVLSQARKARTQGLEVSTLQKMFRDMARA
jgi:ParB family chromosome partitioning protein